MKLEVNREKYSDMIEYFEHLKHSLQEGKTTSEEASYIALDTLDKLTVYSLAIMHGMYDKYEGVKVSAADTLAAHIVYELLSAMRTKFFVHNTPTALELADETGFFRCTDYLKEAYYNVIFGFVDIKDNVQYHLYMGKYKVHILES